jgi:hypothetical protein
MKTPICYGWLRNLLADLRIRAVFSLNKEWELKEDAKALDQEFGKTPPKWIQ